MARGERVVRLAPTHAAATQLPEADTICNCQKHDFVSKYAMRGSSARWTLLDEVSMCVVPVLAALDQLRLDECRICTFGDWDQLEPEGTTGAGVLWVRMHSERADCISFGVTARCADGRGVDVLMRQISNSTLVTKAISESRERYGHAVDVCVHFAPSAENDSTREAATSGRGKGVRRSTNWGRSCISVCRRDRVGGKQHGGAHSQWWTLYGHRNREEEGGPRG